MLIGINFEGRYDEAPLEEIISRIILRERPDLGFFEFRKQSAGGTLHGQVQKALAIFLDIDPPCESVIFFTDTDEDSQKFKQIKKEIEEACLARGFSRFILGYANPELEEWFLKEENALKRILKLDSGKPLSLRHGSGPKETLENLFDDYPPEIELTKTDLYRMVATEINIDFLISRNKDFKKFYYELVSRVKL